MRPFEKVANRIDSPNFTDMLKAIESLEADEEIQNSAAPVVQLIKAFQPAIGGLIADNSIVATNVQIADAYMDLDHYREAIPFYEKALSAIQAASKRRLIEPSAKRFAAEIGEIHYQITRAEMLLGNLENAQNSIESAIAAHESYFPKERFQKEDPPLIAKLEYGYGVASLGKLSGNFKIASESLENESAPSEQGLSDNVFLPIIQTTPCNNTQAYFACKQKYFATYIDILMQQSANTPSAVFEELAFEASERARVHSPQIFQNLEDVDSLTPERARLLQRRNRLNEVASLSEIQQAVVDDNTLLLEYFLGEETSYLWVVSSDQPLQTIELPPRSTIEAKARAFLSLISGPDGQIRPKTTAAVGQELSEIILGSVSDQLDDKRLLIVGDGILQYLPFSTLPDPTSAPSPLASTTGGEFAPHLRPLLLNHEIVTLPSASALASIREDRLDLPEPTKALAVFADPVFNHRDDRVDSIRIAPSLPPLSAQNLDDIDILYSPLPETKAELSQIESLVSSEGKQIFTGYDASLNSALETDLGQFRMVHFATHGIFNSDAPERSGVVLSGLDAQGVLQPGLLSPDDAFDALNLLGTELVVLSGCRTGLGRGETIREGLTGFTGGLLAAGTDRIVTSLWSVEDQATKELMSRFYERMLNPDNEMTAAQALRTAQISMWKDPRWQAPYYWSAFVIQGEWQ